MAALIPLTRVAMGVCDEIGDTGYKQLARLMRYVNLGAKDLILNVVPYWSDLVVTSRILPIGGNYMVDLPDDYIYYTKVGILSGGRIALLGLSEELAGGDTSFQNCGCSPEATQDICNICSGATACNGGYSFYNVWNGNNQVGEMFGLTGGNCYPGYFKEDKANNRIILNTDLSAVNGQLIIEYKADPTINGISVVPSETELALRSFVHWRNSLNSRPQVAQVHRNDYEVEYVRLKRMYNALTQEEWRSLFLRGTQSSVKR